jgi:hypothetical protein
MWDFFQILGSFFTGRREYCTLCMPCVECGADLVPRNGESMVCMEMDRSRITPFTTFYLNMIRI